MCITSRKLLTVVCEYTHTFRQTVQHMGQTHTHKFEDSPSHSEHVSLGRSLQNSIEKFALHQGDSTICVGLLLHSNLTLFCVTLPVQMVQYTL